MIGLTDLPVVSSLLNKIDDKYQIFAEVFPSDLLWYLNRTRRPIEVINDKNLIINRCFQSMLEFQQYNELKNNILSNIWRTDRVRQIREKLYDAFLNECEIDIVDFMTIGCDNMIMSDFSVFGIKNYWLQRLYVLDAWKCHVMYAQIDHDDLKLFHKRWNRSNSVFILDLRFFKEEIDENLFDNFFAIIPHDRIDSFNLFLQNKGGKVVFQGKHISCLTNVNV